MDNFHTSVLLKEVIYGLNIRKGAKYIDGTIGGGGHTREILRRGGKVLGIDQDEDAIRYLKKQFELEISKGQLVVVCSNFSRVEDVAREYDFLDADGVLLDLGVSSYQIEKSGRGFSFLRDETLDMRMSSNSGEDEDNISAKDLVNRASEDELYNIFSKYGEEKNSRLISAAIISRRKIKPIETTGELVKIVLGVVPKNGGIHPATKVFQALRIAVNSEIENLKKGLEAGFEVLGSHGRLAIISFHSLEDRTVKLFFAGLVREGKGELINKKVIIPSLEEARANRRSRSAKLRIIARLDSHLARQEKYG